ncbi:vomeronasal type-2 receptor 116-like [Apodemus sylvaticus]|uniref:vomeronasal type-2 receptor 116-like n=1 Tax=Apodemus sylvaticus TaxID=10129 RepID=UPI002243C46B|nr:vomeronasal type-2 receptor 116-like [Apodemus sylvaticus]
MYVNRIFCVFIPWSMQIPSLECAFQYSECYFRIKENFHCEGDVVIGAFFPLHTFYTANKTAYGNVVNYYKDFHLQYTFKNYQFVLALIFAIEEINRNPHLLSNISLGFDVYNVPYTEKNTLMSTLVWLTGQRNFMPNYNCRMNRKSAAALTGTSWATSAQMGTLLHLYKFPQVREIILTFGPSDPILSDRGQFSSLYQMAPNDTSLSLAMVSLLIHFNWSWVGLILIDDHKGTQILSHLREEMDRNRICLALVEMIPVTWNSFSYNFWKNLKKIQKSLANVFIIYGDTDSLQGLMSNLSQQLITWKVWIMSSQWDKTKHADYFLLDSFHGSLIFSHHHEESFEFSNFIQTIKPSKYPEDPYLPKLWYALLNCSFSKFDCQVLENCQPNASLELSPTTIVDTNMSEESHNIYISVYAVAHTLHEMSLQQYQMQSHINTEEMVFFPWQLHHFLRKIHKGEHMSLEWKWRLIEKYDILNFWNFPKGLGLKVKVGTFSLNAQQGQQLSLSEHMIQWPTRFTKIPQSVCYTSCWPGFRKATQEGRGVCCYDCIPCPDNEISNETDADQCVKCPETHFSNTEKNNCLQKSMSFLAYNDPLGIVLTTIALCFSAFTLVVFGVFVKHRNTPVVKANNRSLSYILLMTLVFCFLCSLLFIGQPNTATCIMQQTAFGIVFSVALSTVLAKAITVVMAFKVMFPGSIMRWLIVSRAPNYIIPICTLIQIVLCGIYLGTSPPFLDQDLHSEHGHILIICNKGSVVFFHCILGYLCFLALGSCVMAFLSRNLPDTFNEAKFLSFSMQVFFCVWVTFLPVYYSTKGKVMVAMQVFSIFASSAGILGLIFAPKCYIILLRPDQNSLHHIRDTAYSRRNKTL